MDNDKLIRKFDKQAAIYARRRSQGADRAWRQPLLREASGHVLEVGVGAGANFPYYSGPVRVTAVDFSQEMLNRAKESAADYGIEATFVRSDIEALTLPDRSFDTIVSTLTLCGYANPEQVLAQFNRWCKQDGRILLMEHGLSARKWLVPLQHAANPLFKRIVGCNLNRDVLSLVRASGMRIRRVERYMTGAMNLIWAQPKPD